MSFPQIDYALLGRAVEFYKACGFTYVEVPWAVEDVYIAATLPSPDRSLLREKRHVQNRAGEIIYQSVHERTLVGSAEQGFLKLDDLPAGKWFGVTPCFRVESQTNDLYQPWFMKLELYDTRTKQYGPSYGDSIAFCLLQTAQAFFREEGQDAEMVVTDIGADLEINGIEVGSYGHRYHDSFGSWAYGTGLALPRFSVASATR